MPFDAAVRHLANRPGKRYTGGRALKPHRVYENPLPTVQVRGGPSYFPASLLPYFPYYFPFPTCTSPYS